MLIGTQLDGFMSGGQKQQFRIVITDPTYNFVLSSTLTSLGWDGKECDVVILVASSEDDLYPLNVPDPNLDAWDTYAGAWIGSATTTDPAMLLDGLPVGSTVTIDNRGFICGRGGDGGAGGKPTVSSGLGGNGGNGGPAIKVDSPNWYAITIINRGFIGGGGGGGGGGSTYSTGTDRGGAGGPGAGLPAGTPGVTLERSDWFQGYRTQSFPYGGCGGGLRSEVGATSIWAQSSAGAPGGSVGENGQNQPPSVASTANPGGGLGGTAGAAFIDPNSQIISLTNGPNIPGTGGTVWGTGIGQFPVNPGNYVWSSSEPACQVRSPALQFAYDGDTLVVMGNGSTKKMKDLVIGDEVATFTPNYIYASGSFYSGANIMDEDDPIYYGIPSPSVGDIIPVPPNEYLGLFRSVAVVVSNPPFTVTTALDRFDVKGTESQTFTNPLSNALISYHGRVYAGNIGSAWDFTNTSYANKRILFRTRTGVIHPDNGTTIPPNSTHAALPPGERRFDKWLLGACAPTSSGTYTVYSPMLGAKDGVGATGLVIAATFTASTALGTEERSMLVLTRGNKVMPQPAAPSAPQSAWPEWKTGTQFTMSNGTTKAVQDLVAGDLLRCVSGHPVLHGKFKRSDFYDVLGVGRFSGNSQGSYGVPHWKRSETVVTTSTVRVKSVIPARVLTAPNAAVGSIPPLWALTSQNSDELFYQMDRMFFITMRGGSGPSGIFTPSDEFRIESVARTLDNFPGNAAYDTGWRPGNGAGVALLKHRAADPYRPILSNGTTTSSYTSAFTTGMDADAAGQTYYLEIETTGANSCAVIIANGYYVVNVENDNLFVSI